MITYIIVSSIIYIVTVYYFYQLYQREEVRRLRLRKEFLENQLKTYQTGTKIVDVFNHLARNQQAFFSLFRAITEYINDKFGDKIAEFHEMSDEEMHDNIKMDELLKEASDLLRKPPDIEDDKDNGV